ncbi:hypothetical protein ACIXCI_11365 [Bacteroides fragilis]|nr:hypothetical protein [Bacteroides fragilis]
MIGADFPVSPIDASSLTICYKWKIYEDKAEVFKTELIRRFPFPEIEGEKFISEAIVWNKISVCDSPLLRCVNTGIYMCEYLPDGLTANFIKLMKRNPKGGILYYKSLFNLSCIRKNPIDILKISLRLSQCIIYSFLRCFGSYL